jgi:hypothetical protein
MSDNVSDIASSNMGDMRDWIHNLFPRRYVGMLEAELARLRAENRALTNSLLGTAGFPPVDFPAAAKPREIPRPRKRSWHQIQAWRETEAVRDSGDERHSGN